jgi:hypothetical protein
MSFPLDAAYQPLVRFGYACFDRLVIRGYERMLQQPAGFVTWARRLIPGQPITASWLTSLARRFQKGVKKFADEKGISIVSSPKGQRKHEVAEAYRRRLAPDSGVYLIIKAREKAWCYESREPMRPNDPLHRNLHRRQRNVDHFYYYLVDKYWGPISLRICSHPPFHVVVFLNGNRWLAREAERQGLAVATKDNSIVRCRDPKTLQEIAETLDWRRIQAVCDHWAYRLLPVLTREERRTSGFYYRWSFIQAEMSHNLVFRNPLRLTEVLERHIDLNRRRLHPCSLKTIFTGRLGGSYKSEIDVSVRHAFGGVTVFKARYGKTILKQYNNHRRTFRTEVCTNHTPDIGIRKSIQNLEALRRRLLELMTDFQAAQAPVLATTVKRGELTALAEPGRVNDVPTAGIRLENERILGVLSAIPRVAHHAEGFRSSELRIAAEEILQSPYSMTQTIYDLRKLRGKGLVVRRRGRRRYRATEEGLRVAAVLTKLKDSLLEPMLPGRRKRRRRRGKELPAPDCFYRDIENLLDDLCAFLGLKAAA